MCNATIVCVHAYVCVTIVIHTVIHAVVGILRNMQVFNYLGNLKYRHVQCNYNVCARVLVCARACLRACACVTIVVHTDMYAVIGILRNMQVFN